MWLNLQLTSSDQMMRELCITHMTQLVKHQSEDDFFLKKLHVSSEQGIETFHPQTRAFENCNNDHYK